LEASQSKSLSGSSGKDDFDFDFDFDFENVQPQCIFHQLLRSYLPITDYRQPITDLP